MQQLTGMDASFLYAETPRAHMAGGGISIYDPSTAPGGKVTFKGILDHLDSRLHAARVFRQRLVRVPFDLDHPYWIEDPDFDLEFHVRHIALPRPGDWRQLCIQVARLVSRPLDLDRPLWELYVIEGLDNVGGIPPGSFALVTKVHHAAIDGMSGMEMTTAIHDESPIAEPPSAPDTWRPGSVPSAAELLWRAGANNAARPAHAGRVIGRAVPQLGRLTSQIRRGTITPPPSTIPRTRWSGPVSAHRVFDAIRLELDDLRTIKQSVDGATINDVVLTVVGGGLRSYLVDKDELPADPLIAMAPISVRTEAEKGAAGNMVSGMFTTLGTDIADPLERLAAVRESTHNSKEFTNALGARTLVDMADLMPGGLVGLGARTSARLSLANRMRPVFNTTVTNMPGPRHPLYMAGAELVAMYGAGMITEGMGLIHPVMSYCGDITISFTSCREMLPDPAFYAACLQTSFDDLAALTTPRRGARRKQAAGAGRSH
ncbi:MAG: wax ester/triacylglycerol synthase family O-acyltransferase [Ilumatobacteraceae bacterium]